MKNMSKMMLLLLIIPVLLLIFLYNTVTENRQIILKMSEEVSNQSLRNTEVTTKVAKRKNGNLKYILQWTSPKNVPFVYMGEGQEGFISRNCPYTNCFVTGNRSYLSDLTMFDVIAFAGPEAVRLFSLPTKRSPRQKYVFATIESSDNYPVCSNRFDNYFNWTWTYKLDSEVRWGYITVRDEFNNIVGPNKNMHWMKLEDMKPVSDEIKEQIKTKTKAAAWFVSNCFSRSHRKQFVQDLQNELRQYKLEVDIYGSCGPLKCSRDNEECNEMIKKTYYFYLSFENSFSEDYATEKLFHALKNTAVPVVYGGANYSRFMPDGIYLDARVLGPKALAAKMNELINDPVKYSEYFKWRNHYSYYRKFESLETDTYCLFCTTLNNNEMVKATTIYKNFREWWDPPNRC